MNTLRGLTARFLLLTVPMGIGCRQAEVLPNSGSLAVGELGVDKPNDSKPKLTINTPPVSFKINDNDTINCARFNKEEIINILSNSGVKGEHLERFADDILNKFDYLSNLLKNNPVQLFKLQLIEDYDLSNVELEIFPGTDFDLGMGFPGVVNPKKLGITIDESSFVLTPTGVYFKYTKNEETNEREGLINTKFGRLLIIHREQGGIIVIDPTKGFVVPQDPDPALFTKALFQARQAV